MYLIITEIYEVFVKFLKIVNNHKESQFFQGRQIQKLFPTTPKISENTTNIPKNPKISSKILKIIIFRKNPETPIYLVNILNLG
jgi:hypothetical protein